MAKVIDCIKAIKESVKDGKITDAAAKVIFDRAERMAKERAAKKSITIEQAWGEVSKEMKAEEKSKSAAAKRNAALNTYKRLQMRSFASANKNYAKGFQGLLESANRSVKDLQDRAVSGFEDRVRLEAGREGEIALDKQEVNNDHFWAALESINNGEAPDAKLDKTAVAVAKSYDTFLRDAVANANRNGADIKQGPGYYMSRTWSKDRLVAMGRDGDGVFNKQKGRKAFREFMQKGDMNIDWERTYSGEHQDLWWNGFYDSLVDNDHNPSHGDIDQIAGAFGKGSVSGRLNKKRALWFMDAKSEQKAFEALSNHRSPVSLIYSMINNMSRNIALLQVAGPDGIGNLTKTKTQLHKLATELPDSNKQTADLEKSMFDTQINMLSGQSLERQSGWFENTMRTLRSVTNLRYAGDFVITNFPDLAFLNHRMTQLGLGQLEQAAMIKDAMLGRLSSAEKQQVAREQYVTHSSIARHLVTHDGYSLAGDKLDRLERQTYRLSGYDKWNRALESVAAEAFANRLGAVADLKYDALPDSIKSVLMQEPNLTPQHWDLMRGEAYYFKDKAAEMKDMGIDESLAPLPDTRWLTHDRVARLPDDKVRAWLLAQDRVATPQAMQRVRDELSGMYGRMKELIIDKSLNRPELRTRYFLGQGLSPGSVPRILMDTLTMYKGFAVQATANVFDDVTQGNGWVGAKDYFTSKRGIVGAARLIAATTIAGYFTMTAKDYLDGKTRRTFFKDDWTPNTEVFMAAMARGGGLGVMSNFLFDDYDKNFRTFSSTLVGGPVLGQLDPIVASLSAARNAALSGDEVQAQDFQTAGANQLKRLPVPYLNLWYTRPFLNYLVMYNIREMLSPGVLERQEKRTEDQNLQSYWLQPSRTAAIPITEPGNKLKLMLDSLSE